MSNILRMSTEHITAPLADEGNYVYWQSRGAHNIKHIYNKWKLPLRSNSELFDDMNDAITARPLLYIQCARYFILCRSNKE